MTKHSPPTPASLGFRMPAEWEKQEAVWLAWPYNPESWKGHEAGAKLAFAEMIAALTPHEHVHLLVLDENMREQAMSLIKTLPFEATRLHLHVIETGDVWFRDYGPTFVVKDNPHDVRWVKWGYNAYGNKYDDLLVGNDVPHKMPIDQTKKFNAGIILEGGSIDVNGTGTVLTTESCLLSPDRNPNLSKEDIEEIVKSHLGVTNILWLGEGIAGDDTTGHVDDLTRFVSRNVVVTAVEEDPTDENYKALKENEERLTTMKDERGMALTVIPLPMPKALVTDGRRMAATYANFLIANDVVLVPIYKDKNDARALEILGKCFPDRHMIGIDCRELIVGNGSIHCSTQQQPA